MPYRFKIDEPVEKGFRRIAREQLDLAVAELSAPQILPVGVHESRKALKRLRALVRLASSAIGPVKARQRTRALGQIGRLLSARRDQAVMLDTISKLSEGGPEVAMVLAPLHSHLVSTSGDQGKPLDADSAAQARRLLVHESKKFARTRFRRRGFAALEGGLEKCYRQARKAIKQAYGEPTDEGFHSMRKAVQWHWRQMSLLGRAWPDEFAVRVTAARELSQILGDDHDLAILIAAVTAAEGISAEQKEAIVELCLSRQRVLRQSAEPRAGRLFAETPKAFTKRVAAYWHYGRNHDQNLDVRPNVFAEPQKQPSVAKGPEVVANGQGPKIAPAQPRLAAKSTSSAPSQRRA